MNIIIVLGTVIAAFWLAIRFLSALERKPSARGSKANKHRHFFSQVHGITHKNDDGSSRQNIIRHCGVGEELVLEPEPTNRHDPHAVKICRKNGEQLGYWQGDGRMAHDLASGWTYRVTIDEIYPFKENRNKRGVRLLLEVLTMSRTTEARKQKQVGKKV